MKKFLFFGYKFLPKKLTYNMLRQHNKKITVLSSLFGSINFYLPQEALSNHRLFINLKI